MRSSSPKQAPADGSGSAGKQAPDKYGPALKVPPQLLKGERRNEEQPCLTPIDCVLDNHCAGHCGCR